MVAAYNHKMAKDVIHISEAEATNDCASLTATLDGNFGRDLEEIINSHREPLNPTASTESVP